MSLQDKLDEANRNIWVAAFDANSMKHEFKSVEDYERAYAKYRETVLAEAKEQILQAFKESLPEERQANLFDTINAQSYNQAIRDIKDRLEGK